MTNLELLRMLSDEGLITLEESEDGEVKKAFVNNEEDYGPGIEIYFNLNEDVDHYNRLIPVKRKNRSILDGWEGFCNG